MGFNVFEKVRERSREEWRDDATNRVAGFRSWVRANGEKALLLGFVAGIVFVMAPSFFITVVFITAVILFVLWNIAQPAATRGSSTASSPFERRGPDGTSDGGTTEQ